MSDYNKNYSLLDSIKSIGLLLELESKIENLFLDEKYILSDIESILSHLELLTKIKAYKISRTAVKLIEGALDPEIVVRAAPNLDEYPRNTLIKVEVLGSTKNKKLFKHDKDDISIIRFISETQLLGQVMAVHTAELITNPGTETFVTPKVSIQ